MVMFVLLVFTVIFILVVLTVMVMFVLLVWARGDFAGLAILTTFLTALLAVSAHHAPVFLTWYVGVGRLSYTCGDVVSTSGRGVLPPSGQGSCCAVKDLTVAVPATCCCNLSAVLSEVLWMVLG